MGKTFVVSAVGFFLCLTAPVASAAEYPWSPIARQCGNAAAEQLRAKTGCASCTDSWTSGAWCAVSAYYQNQIPEPILTTCITRVWNERLRARTCSACGNPIDQVFLCVNSPY
jgi:hypothetical protein